MVNVPAKEKQPVHFVPEKASLHATDVEAQVWMPIRTMENVLPAMAKERPIVFAVETAMDTRYAKTVTVKAD